MNVYIMYVCNVYMIYKLYELLYTILIKLSRYGLGSRKLIIKSKLQMNKGFGGVEKLHWRQESNPITLK